MNDLNRSIKIFIDGTEASAGVKKIEDAITQLENKISSLDKSESGYSKKSKILQKNWKQAQDPKHLQAKSLGD